MENDKVEDYLIKLFDEAAFDQWLDDGRMYCSDSNRSLSPSEIAKHIRMLIAEEQVVK